MLPLILAAILIGIALPVQSGLNAQLRIGVAHPLLAAFISFLVGTVALSAGGLAFDSIDGEPVHVLFLLISPDQQPGPHLRALDAVVQKTKDEALVAKLKASRSVEEIWALLS